jgi:hypothetical protein
LVWLGWCGVGCVVGGCMVTGRMAVLGMSVGTGMAVLVRGRPVWVGCTGGRITWLPSSPQLRPCVAQPTMLTNWPAIFVITTW